MSLISVANEPIPDERLRALIDEELKTLNIKQGDSMKTIDELNREFLKANFNSLTHRAEGRSWLFFEQCTDSFDI